MKSITIDGKTFEIEDAKARKRVEELSTKVSKHSEEKLDRTEVDTLVKNTVENEKGNIVQLLIEELNGLPVFGVIDKNNTVTVTTLLPDGVYALKYENKDGATTEIGQITVGNGEVIKYTNLVDTTLTTDTTVTTASGGWLENVRINSSNAIVTADGNHITNNIVVGDGVKLRCKGMDINGGYGRIYVYNGTSFVYAFNCSNNLGSFVEITDDYSEILVSEILKVVQANKGASTTFDNVRFGGTLTATKEDVIVTIDEEIT